MEDEAKALGIAKMTSKKRALENKLEMAKSSKRVKRENNSWLYKGKSSIENNYTQVQIEETPKHGVQKPVSIADWIIRHTPRNSTCIAESTTKELRSGVQKQKYKMTTILDFFKAKSCTERAHLGCEDVRMECLVMSPDWALH